MGTSQEAIAEVRYTEQKRPEVDIRSLRLHFLRKRPGVQEMLLDNLLTSFVMFA